MNFRVSARTILHLGSELISSDGVAFYELIKNSLDARSPEVRLDVVYRLDHEVYSEIIRELGEDRETPYALRRHYLANLGRNPRDWTALRELALAALIGGTAAQEEIASAISAAETREGFVESLRSANYIEFDDDGAGMSMDILQHVYLTIGTSYRANQKNARPPRSPTSSDAEDVILGEKGLGRLSAMRLGDRVLIVTGMAGETRWNQLEIDWNDFADAADDDLESVPVTPVRGVRKNAAQSGTRIKISALKSGWSAEKLQSLAAEQFSRLVDPFDAEARLPLALTFNSAPVTIPTFAGFLLDQAHGRLKASLIVDGPDAPRVEGTMEYRLHRRSRPLRLKRLDLLTLTNIDAATIRRSGGFELEMYWFNRRILTKLEGIGSLAVVRRILAEWAGGVAVYRDGYRVNPYGGPNDDWLDLDRDAFSTSGFKLNRGQIVGRVRISQHGNPYLIDQTNREGLKENPEKRAFVTVLAASVEIYRQYLNETDRDIDQARRVTAVEALERFRAEDERVASLLPILENALATVKDGPTLTRRLRDTLGELRSAAEFVQRAAGAQEQERSRVLHLASIGLMIEILAHELYRSTSAGLQTIAQARKARDAASTSTSLRVLDSQLRTLQKRLKVLDPLSTNARQTKERFELVSWVRDIVEGFASRNGASRIAITARSVPQDACLEVRAVKGMFVQVLENVLTNSIFWVRRQHQELEKLGLHSGLEDDNIGSIRVAVDVPARTITVTDSGPGIPEERRETVFEPFFSTKPQKQGKGLGLYIAREIAEYHGGRLHLGPADRDGQINSVVFEIGSIDE